MKFKFLISFCFVFKATRPGPKSLWTSVDIAVQKSLSQFFPYSPTHSNSRLSAIFIFKTCFENSKIFERFCFSFSLAGITKETRRSHETSSGRKYFSLPFREKWKIRQRKQKANSFYDIIKFVEEELIKLKIPSAFDIAKSNKII